MDIKQSITATAMVTLGKDMTFRDYAQACWRMRGLGRGQSVRVIVVPELSQLITTAFPNSPCSFYQSNIVCWLLKNSVFSEHIQQMQLCQQDISHCWRKVAFQQLLNSNAPKSTLKTRFNDQASLVNAIQVFREPIDFNIPSKVPMVESSTFRIQRIAKERCKLLTGAETESLEVIRSELYEKISPILNELENLEKQGNIIDKHALSKEYDSEIVQEQEQQQEKQIQVVNQFAIRYAREKEPTFYWNMENISTASSFYKLSELKLYSMFEPQNKYSVEFPEDLYVSKNHTHSINRSENQRRLKHVVVILLRYNKFKDCIQSVIVNLSEAESIRQYIFQNHSVSSEIGLYDLHGRWLVPFDLPTKFQNQFSTQLQCIRFWNAEFRYNTSEMLLLLQALSLSDLKTRSQYWDMLLLCRKKTPKGWENTSISTLFKHNDASELQKLYSVAVSLKSSLSSRFDSLILAFERFDGDNDGLLSFSDLQNNGCDIAQEDFLALLKHSSTGTTNFSEDIHTIFINLRQFMSMVHIVNE